jgi:hypothetical protein
MSTLYSFNYNDSSNGPTVGEVTLHTNISIEIGFAMPLFILYRLLDKYNETSVIEEPVEMLLLSTTNPAHSLGEFTSFLEYYLNSQKQLKVCINSYIVIKMPYLYGLIKQFIPENNLILIESDKIYNFKSITLRRNHHFVYLNRWETFSFIASDNILHFNDLQRAKELYCVNCIRLFDKVKEIYETHRHKYNLSDSIMMIKTSRENLSVSIQRAISYPNQDILNIFAKKGIKFVEVTQFRDIFEYICTIYHAKNIIFSYGGPMCINRFFCNPNANIIVLANTHYKPEYDYNNSAKNYWHVKHAMLAPVKSQHFIIDFDNELNHNNITQIFSLLE